jgi:hypothetical protein
MLLSSVNGRFTGQIRLQDNHKTNSMDRWYCVTKSLGIQGLVIHEERLSKFILKELSFWAS